MNSQEISEALIDGSGDLGIDAIILNEDHQALTVMQFKFPSKKENINCEIDQGDILKTFNAL